MTGLLSRRDALLRTAGLAAASLLPAARRCRAAARKPVPARRIDAALQAKVAAREIPGVVAMAANEPSVVYQGAFGPRNMATATPMSTDTIFRIASMVKLLTSVAALQLVERGKLKLDEPAGNIDPTLASPQVLAGFDAKGVPQLRPAQKPITLRNLLTHTSGFSYPLWDPNVVRYLKAARGNPALAAPAADVRAGDTDGPMAAASTMSAGWSKSPAGKTSIAIFSDNITGPLGMNDTGFVDHRAAARASGQPACARRGRKAGRTTASKS